MTDKLTLNKLWSKSSSNGSKTSQSKLSQFGCVAPAWPGSITMWQCHEVFAENPLSSEIKKIFRVRTKYEVAGVVGSAPTSSLYSQQRSQSRPQVLDLAYSETLNKGTNCGVLQGTEACMDWNFDWLDCDHYYIISCRLSKKKKKSPKPNHMITSGWTPAQHELESKLALAKPTLPWPQLSNNNSCYFCFVFFQLDEQSFLGCL